MLWQITCAFQVSEEHAPSFCAPHGVIIQNTNIWVTPATKAPKITVMLGKHTTSLNMHNTLWKSLYDRPGRWWDEISKWTVDKILVITKDALKHLRILSSGSAKCSRCIISLFTSLHSYATPWHRCPLHITEWELDELRYNTAISWWTLPKSIEATVKQLHIMTVTPPCMTTWPLINH